MTENDIMQQGEVAKYIVSFTPRPDFDPETMDFYVELYYGMQGEMKTVTKSQFLQGTAGEWVFTMDTSDMIGRVKARMVMLFTDSDMASGVRQEVDEQVIAFVITSACPKIITCPACSQTTNVTYTRTEESGVASLYMQLVTTEADGTTRALLTSDNMHIFALRNHINQIN